jgi:V/A-type H+-transporting ATPase subunit I
VAENAKGLPADRAEEYNKELERLNAEGDKAAEDIAALATLYDDIEFAGDYFTIRIDKYENLAKLAMSGNILVLNGYIPEDKVEVLTKELESKFAAAVSVTDTAEDDEPPILLKNNTFSAPVESVTEMYALPNNQDVDPNPVMAIFYYTFFGLMLSDAGYGLLMVSCRPVREKEI